MLKAMKPRNVAYLYIYYSPGEKKAVSAFLQAEQYEISNYIFFICLFYFCPWIWYSVDVIIMHPVLFPLIEN